MHLIIVVELFPSETFLYVKKPPHILPIQNVTTNSNSLFVNFRWTFTFCVEKSYDGTHLEFGEILDRRCHFKHVSIKAGSTTIKRARLTGKGSRSTAVLP
jgi:hypothetical protein